MAIIPSRKGVFMTLIAVAIMILLFSWIKLTTPTIDTEQANLLAERTRIIVMNKYMDVLETHMANSASVAGYLALQNISEKIRSNKLNITSTAQLNNELMKCMWLNATDCMPVTQTLNYSIKNLTGLAQQSLNIKTNYRINNISVQDTQPFIVTITINVSYNISDGTSSNLATWSTTSLINTTINLEGVLDPLYMYQYQNRTFKTGTRTFHSTNYTKYQFNHTRFVNFYDDANYIATYNKGVSVIQRYTKNWASTSSCCGITSIVQYNELNQTVFPNTILANLSLRDQMLVTRYKYPCTADTPDVVGIIAPMSNPNVRIDAATLLDTFNYSQYKPVNPYFVTTCLS